MPATEENNRNDLRFTSGSETTRTITFVVLIAYIVILVGFGFGGAFAKQEPETNWYELVKIGFTTLGSALTLILGYYFGQREVSAVKEVRQEAAKKVEAAEAADEQNRAKLLNLINRSPATTSQPESIDSVDRSKLPVRAPVTDPAP